MINMLKNNNHKDMQAIESRIKGAPYGFAIGDAGAVRKEIKQCIIENKSAVEMWPDKYSRCDGKFI